MPRICHTADIHIRSLSRHDEFRKTFQLMIDDCRRQAVDHIFIGGDIFHTKTTGISPEYIDLMTWWLNSMAEVAEVHMMLGNHDGNLVNMSRQDAVSPVVDAINNPRVHLYKKSGLYEFTPGFTFCVFSLFDEVGWKNVVPAKDKVNIACFHGSVRECLTETDWKVEEGLNREFFSNYDFTFLGDIHRRQNLVFRDGKPVMAYPGTLIQQNYAESLDHGYLLWDIRDQNDWDVSFRQLPNEKPFVTIDWVDDVETTLQLAKKYPVGSRFRIRSQSHLRQDEMHSISESLKTSMSALEVTYKSDDFISTKEIITDGESITKSDLRSADVLLKFFNDFKEDAELTQEETVAASDQIKQCLSAVTEDDYVVRGSKWSLNQLKWDNTFAYGENNAIDFDKLRGIVGIFGANRTGKSSIVGTMMYSLFNTTDRGPMKNIYVCNVRKPHCYTRAVITHNGITYAMERQTTKSTNKRGIVSAATSLNLFRMREDGEFDDLCGEQRNDTEKTVRNLIGSADDFLMTSLSAQGETSQFILQGSSKRRAIVSRFLDLDIFDKMYEVANKELNALKSQLRNFPERDWDAMTSSSKDELRLLDAEIKNFSDTMSDTQIKLNLLRSDLSHRDVTPVTQADVIMQRARVTSFRDTHESLVESMSELSTSIESMRLKLSDINKIIDVNDINDMKRRRDAQRVFDDSILKLRHLLDREGTLLKQQKKSLQILSEVPCGDDYPTCKFIKDAHEDKTKMSEQSNKVVSAAAALQAAEKSAELANDSMLSEKITRHEKATDLASKIMLEIASKETRIEKLRSSIASTSSSLLEAEAQLRLLDDALKNDENIEVVSIRNKIEDLSDVIRRTDALRLTAVTRRGTLAAYAEKVAEEKMLRSVILNKMHVQELVSSAFSKRGIPLTIMKSQLPLVNIEVSKILHGIVDFTIELESDESTDALEIYIDYGDSRRIIELASGMEKTIASIALRVAMINISSLPRSDIFIIDEGFGTLDSSGVEACNRLLISLKKYFKTVIVITHVDGIKDSADHIIDILKNEKDAAVRHT